MKSLTFAIAFIGAIATASAFAQSTTAPAPAQQNATTTQVAQNSSAAISSAGSWVPPYGQGTGEKTRAQVYQELVRAEKATPSNTGADNCVGPVSFCNIYFGS
ncbi:MAG: hypothetical protein QOC89_3092 [Paraburkholderia sp.]|jgi:hypothetical protein|uniref:DUF4148 domain-containing protein n=1 Tax=Paraburkholderia sp. TaxID=1926495 RepID=UPI002AFE9F7D|nr:DUF4148 domain-containing protein [Paraburkholderia sp.]MEA3085395.1 hypothetical protein [Paraburkholderia sp.]